MLAGLDRKGSRGEGEGCCICIHPPPWLTSKSFGHSDATKILPCSICNRHEQIMCDSNACPCPSQCVASTCNAPIEYGKALSVQGHTHLRRQDCRPAVLKGHTQTNGKTPRGLQAETRLTGNSHRVVERFGRNLKLLGRCSIFIYPAFKVGRWLGRNIP